MSSAVFFIEDGVHRAVAARENSLTAIPAVLFEPGQRPRAVVVYLDALYSPRTSSSRSDPRHNYPALEALLSTVGGRARMPPISIQPLGASGQPASVPLAQVRIVS